ncbi:TetR/AcrR family transcriptional regulator [Amycolatopsis pithecellobii]|uniref:TetR family transcriptional regulator n=1 Tax=Amycolatopsis pithecellobii TaxID=664692 RepID=A0A6N7YYK4_9PSEU|nr:TetR family transcriptional regulator [Amycolatopsis pithecellobii]MTD52521.1 TetR family transcriptional regulator [Amycolatopsis pithecellobii]
MPRLTESSRLRRRDDIAAAAMRCFARDGFSNTSMADIIREAGSSAGSVYSNFKNKSDLVRYAASNALRDLIATVTAEPPSERTPSSVLLHLLRASADGAHARTLLQIWAEAPQDTELADVAHQSTRELHALIEGLLVPWCRKQTPNSSSPQADADALADAVLTALQGFLVRIAIDRDANPAVLIDRTVAVFRRL